MREIEFRVWNKIGNVMEPWERVVNGWSMIGVFQSDESRLPLEYIGLKDRNGVKIYESDIVCFRDSLDEENNALPERVGVVGFADASFRIERNLTNHYRWMDYDCEVIGNVFENPDLLTE